MQFFTIKLDRYKFFCVCLKTKNFIGDKEVERFKKKLVFTYIMKNLVDHFTKNHSKTTINSTDKLRRATIFMNNVFIVLQRLLRLFFFLLPFRSITINKVLFISDNTIIMTSTWTHIYIWVSIIKSETNVETVQKNRRISFYRISLLTFMWCLVWVFFLLSLVKLEWYASFDYI